MGRIYVKNYLFAEPSVIGGISSILDVGATLQQYNYSDSDASADDRALANDWRAVGADIEASIIKYEEQLG